ncbi:MAG: AgmX/PglI C-terminal domain-containing protein [Deltaproteobacteria bacterium]|nr:AgmX/PglI C-terminal domain-containing protein [Deltaproteobacteria bacterium]
MNFPKLRACYEGQLKKDASATGTVSSEFIIDEEGKVAKLDVTVSGALTDPALAPCWTAVLKALQFPHPEMGKVLVRYPIAVESEQR